MARIGELSIPFPKLEGVSLRQKLYAEDLRRAWVEDNYERFEEIEATMAIEADQRVLEEYGALNGERGVDSYKEHYTSAEMACLFGVDAGGVIATLRRAFDEGDE